MLAFSREVDHVCVRIFFLLKNLIEKLHHKYILLPYFHFRCIFWQILNYIMWIEHEKNNHCKIVCFFFLRWVFKYWFRITTSYNSWQLESFIFLLFSLFVVHCEILQSSKLYKQTNSWKWLFGKNSQHLLTRPFFFFFVQLILFQGIIYCWPIAVDKRFIGMQFFSIHTNVFNDWKTNFVSNFNYL